MKRKITKKQSKQTNRKSRKIRKKDNPAIVYLNTLASTAHRVMYSRLQLAVRLLGSKQRVEGFRWQALGYADVVSLKARLMDSGLSIHTVNLTLAAVRGTAQCAFHLGVMDAGNLLHIKSVKRIPFRALPKGRSLSGRELRKLLKSCQRDKSVQGRRDAAVIATMITTGLRRAEIVALTFDQYDQKSGQLQVTHTKQNRDRLCPLPKIVKKIMKTWLTTRGVEPGALFCRVLKDDQIVIHPLSTEAIYCIVRSRAKEAGLGKVRPHDLRRSFVTRLLECNIDINIVSKLVGHSDIKTTCRYDLRVPNARKCVESIISFK